MTFGIGIPCHNEAQNVGRLLQALCDTWPAGGGPSVVMVVSDASSDGTDAIVRDVAQRAPFPIRLKAQSQRTGKAAAVNNIIDALADTDVIVMMSADILPAPGCVPQLLRAFEQSDVGAAGGRPVPQGPQHNRAVRVTRLLWDLHHRIALRFPKSTEITAFRNLHQHIDETTLADEAELEHSVVAAGYRVAYVPEARIHTMSPLTLRDYLRQRIRVTLGHLRVARSRHYRVGTLSMRHRATALLEVAHDTGLPWDTLPIAIVLEALVYVSARVQLVFGGPQSGRWTRIESAKRELPHNVG